MLRSSSLRCSQGSKIFLHFRPLSPATDLLNCWACVILNAVYTKQEITKQVHLKNDPCGKSSYVSMWILLYSLYLFTLFIYNHHRVPSRTLVKEYISSV